MVYEPKLKPLFYILCIVLCALVILGWYFVYAMSTDVIMMEDEPMPSDMKAVLTGMFSFIIGTWSLSLVTVIIQAVRGYAYSLDETGICNTCMGIMIFSLIIVIPVKCIPYTAIADFSLNMGEPVAKINKKDVEVSFLLRPFVRGEYYFLYRLSCTNVDKLKERISRQSRVFC